jgi:hypothetical protein
MSFIFVLALMFSFFISSILVTPSINLSMVRCATANFSLIFSLYLRL